eukprot:s5172_g2.t1
MDLHFVWQAWPLATWTFTLCGRRGTYGAQPAPVTRLGPVDAASLCVAGVALGDIDLQFVWQAWHLATWSFTLCGRCGTYGTQLAPVTRLGPVDAVSLCVAGVALGDMDLHFVWQTWHLRHSAGWQAWHLATWTFTLCGRRGTYGPQLAPVTRLLPAGRRLILWPLWHSAGSCDALGRGAYGAQLAPVTRLGPVDAAPLCVAGVALGDIDLHFVRQAWHLATWSSTLCGRRGTYGAQLALVTRFGPVDAASLCVAGVALGDMDLHFVWQAWRYGTQLAPVTRLGPVDAASLCVAGVALGDIDLHFVWQAWHLATWTFTLCGKRGTYGTQLGLETRLAWRLATWSFTLCGRRGTYGIQLGPETRLGPVDAASLCVAGVTLCDIDLHFVWQAWRLVTWTFTLCGRHGTYGIQLALVTRLGPVDAASLCVAGVALGDMDLHFVSQWALPDFHLPAPDCSGHRQTATASAQSQQALPDLNPERPIAVRNLEHIQQCDSVAMEAVDMVWLSLAPEAAVEALALMVLQAAVEALALMVLQVLAGYTDDIDLVVVGTKIFGVKLFFAVHQIDLSSSVYFSQWESVNVLVFSEEEQEAFLAVLQDVPVICDSDFHIGQKPLGRDSEHLRMALWNEAVQPALLLLLQLQPLLLLHHHAASTEVVFVCLDLGVFGLIALCVHASFFGTRVWQ